MPSKQPKAQAHLDLRTEVYVLGLILFFHVILFFIKKIEDASS
jgi:hypothetical protein